MMAVDLGSEYLKVSLIKPGRTPIAVVVNEMSKRKTPALVGFSGDERLMGEEAFSFAVRYPETTYARARDMLARPADHPVLTKMLKDHGLPFTLVPHPNRSVAAVQVKEGQVHAAEELVVRDQLACNRGTGLPGGLESGYLIRGSPTSFHLNDFAHYICALRYLTVERSSHLQASVLQYAREIAEAQAGGSVPDVVIAVPAFFGQAQRQALIESASLAGLNVMGLINTHTAAALQFGIERDFSNKTQNIILYDMGSGSTEVALVRCAIRYTPLSFEDQPGIIPLPATVVLKLACMRHDPTRILPPGSHLIPARMPKGLASHKWRWDHRVEGASGGWMIIII